MAGLVESSKPSRIPRLRRQQLTGIFRQRFRQGHYAPGSMLESERTISQNYGVSRFTVRAAMQLLEGEGLIRRQPRRGAVVTSKATSDNASGTTRSGVQMSIVFVRIGSSPLLSTMIAGARRFCSEENSELVVVDAGGSHEMVMHYLDGALPAMAKGLIVWPFDSEDYCRAIGQLQAKGIEVVCLEHTIAGAAASSVEPDAFAGGYRATSHLLERWPGPVFYIGYPNPSSATAREQGWRSAMADHGFIDNDRYCHHISGTEDHVVMGSTGYESLVELGRQMALELFRTEPSPQQGWSVFCSSDLFALGLYQVAKERGLEIGRDVRVVGYGDYPFAKRLDPPLTSVEVPHDEIGYVAAKLLCEQIVADSTHPMRRVLPVELIERASSTAKPLAGGRSSGGRKNLLTV